MQKQKLIPVISSANLVILLAALAKFGMHLYTAPGYGFFFDEFYTVALSRHLAFGYVDLPPLVPALMAISRALLGESLLAMHIVPALAGSMTLVFICLIAREFGGKTFAIAISAIGFIIGPLWLSLDSIFAYDSIDQLVLAGFLFTLVRFIKTGNPRFWIWLGVIAGIACLTKMTILFMGPGFLTALLISKYRRHLLTPWPWLGAVLCVIIVSPYLLWQAANGWPTLEYWTNYGTARVYQASILQYFTNILAYMNPLLLPLWIAGLYHIFRRLDGVNYSFMGFMFLITLVLLFELHASVRLLLALFMPLLAAGAVFVEEMLARIRWGRIPQTAVITYLAAVGIVTIPTSLPVLPLGSLPAYMEPFRAISQSVREFNGAPSYYPLILSARLGWDEIVQDIAVTFNELPKEDRVIAGIFTDWYWAAGAIDMLGPRYGLPHTVSGSLNYYLWGPGYSWDVMLIITSKTNHMAVFFDQCENKGAI